jgi:hypothetical protein
LWCCASVIGCYRCWSICLCLLPSHASASLLFKGIASEFKCGFYCVQWFEYVLLARLFLLFQILHFFESICAPVYKCDGVHLQSERTRNNLELRKNMFTGCHWRFCTFWTLPSLLSVNRFIFLAIETLL